jgi:hypothetical protein
VRDSALRERAADALAATILERLDEPLQVQDRNQLPAISKPGTTLMRSH